jgi:hypothetical protein
VPGQREGEFHGVFGRPLPPASEGLLEAGPLECIGAALDEFVVTGGGRSGKLDGRTQHRCGAEQRRSELGAAILDRQQREPLQVLW